jgi:two-component system, OmpR family, sensor histidine kinase CiaH
VYWVLLAYVVAALIWWFISLSIQNKEMTELKILDLHPQDFLYKEKYQQIILLKDRKTAQYIGEGATFLLLILAGAIFLFRGIRKELRISKEQQNFMMAITHELKTPIAVSKLNLETVQKHKLSDAQQEKLIQNTLTETNRLDTLCNNLLLSSQMEGGGYKDLKEEINLSVLLEEAINAFANRFQNRKVLKNIEQDIFVLGDAFLLQMAVNNLLENALKYSSKEKPIILNLSKEKDKALIQIIDEGQGIAEEEKKLVFKKFYRIGNEATKLAKGTGLGLYLTEKICKTHDSNITIQNNPTGGSIFTFALNIAS